MKNKKRGQGTKIFIKGKTIKMLSQSLELHHVFLMPQKGLFLIGLDMASSLLPHFMALIG
jgi:hypothetical protein